FPSDGDLSQIVYRHRRAERKGATIARFLQYASDTLHPLGVRVSADVFGLAATHDLGIGQVPKRIAAALDAIYPMVYPSHFSPGEYGITDPDAYPGRTVARALFDFRRQVKGRAVLIPWLQDFSLAHRYGLIEVTDQIAAARRQHARGYMLWNPEGVYTRDALAGGSPTRLRHRRSRSWPPRSGRSRSGGSRAACRAALGRSSSAWGRGRSPYAAWTAAASTSRSRSRGER